MKSKKKCIYSLSILDIWSLKCYPRFVDDCYVEDSNVFIIGSQKRVHYRNCPLIFFLIFQCINKKIFCVHLIPNICELLLKIMNKFGTLI